MNYQFIDKKKQANEKFRTREFKKTRAWKDKIAQGICYYCSKKFEPHLLTLDHIVPLSRGGKTIIGNCVPACELCNKAKGCDTPVDIFFRSLSPESAGE